MPLGPDNDPVFEHVCSVADVVRLRHEGHTWRQIADALGVDDPGLMRAVYDHWLRTCQH